MLNVHATAEILNETVQRYSILVDAFEGQIESIQNFKVFIAEDIVQLFEVLKVEHLISSILLVEFRKLLHRIIVEHLRELVDPFKVSEIVDEVGIFAFLQNVGL